nr:hypothetical protein [Tanacetum cinerariifolium]
MDPYEEVSQQGQVHPLSSAYVPDPMKLDEHVPVHVPEPEHLEYHAPSDDDIQDTREPSEDFDETEPFEEEETVVTPPPRHHGARMSVRPQTRMAASTKALMDAFDAGSSPFPLPPTSPAYDQAPLACFSFLIFVINVVVGIDSTIRGSMTIPLAFSTLGYTFPSMMVIALGAQSGGNVNQGTKGGRYKAPIRTSIKQDFSVTIVKKKRIRDDVRVWASIPSSQHISSSFSYAIPAAILTVI